MTRIHVFPIKSLLSNAELVSKESEQLLKDLEERTPFEFDFIPLEKLGAGELDLILVQSGGSEGFFLREIFPRFAGPYYLLTYGSANSLAASLEILTFIHEQNRQGEVLHGDLGYIAGRLTSLISAKSLSNLQKPARLGVVGTPSDWLIGSNVDYAKAKAIFNVELLDIDPKEVSVRFQIHQSEAPQETFPVPFPKEELQKAYALYRALKDVVAAHALVGFTIRCFGLLGELHTSSCLALALLNRDGIIASCEGDIPSLITAYELYSALKVKAFQANPNWIDPVKNELTLAHCTLPLDMAFGYSFDTHFESGIGLGIHGVMKTGDVTVVKIGSELKEFYVEEGTLLQNEYRKDRCRTQIVLHLDAPVSYFLTSSLGNHHQVIYGHHKKELQRYFLALGLREVI